jgi:His/Glu/Gln/Arg/opine family amino acid ABC transporter permease subunit
LAYQWHFEVLAPYWPVFVNGAITTLELTFSSATLGLVLGLPAAVGRESRFLPVRSLMTAYIEFIRGTPALVQIVWIYYCLPILTGIQLSAFRTMIVALGIHEGAYIAEIFRAGIGAVDRGQFAASYSLGMSHMRALRRIILPQAVQKMIPPFMNEFANLLKVTTLGSVIAIEELQHSATGLISVIYRPLEVYTTLAVVFFVITYPLIFLSRKLERLLRARN